MAQEEVLILLTVNPAASAGNPGNTPPMPPPLISHFPAAVNAPQPTPAFMPPPPVPPGTVPPPTWQLVPAAIPPPPPPVASPTTGILSQPPLPQPMPTVIQPAVSTSMLLAPAAYSTSAQPSFQDVMPAVRQVFDIAPQSSLAAPTVSQPPVTTAMGAPPPAHSLLPPLPSTQSGSSPLPPPPPGTQITIHNQSSHLIHLYTSILHPHTSRSSQ